MGILVIDVPWIRVRIHQLLVANGVKLAILDASGQKKKKRSEEKKNTAYSSFFGAHFEQVLIPFKGPRCKDDLAKAGS